ncbi:MAG: WD40 repeat domain-containing protein [Bacteroidota bacterium]
MSTSLCQTNEELSAKIEDQETVINALRLSELAQSMSQRSLLMPSYQSELKALVAKQAYDFWKNSEETYVSHLNIYLALYYGNKYLNNEDDRTPFNRVIGHSESVVSIQFGNEPNIFYSAGSDGKVLKWDLNNLENVPSVIYEGPYLIRSLDISHDGKWVLVVTKDKGVVLIALEDLQSESGGIAYDPEPVQSAVFFPNELKYLTVNEQGEIKIKGYAVDLPEVGKVNSRVNVLAIKSDDNDIYAGLENGQLLVFGDPEVNEIHGKSPFAINALAISPDRKLLIIGRELGDAIIWDIEKKEVVRTISGHQSAVTDVDFHPTEAKVLTASRDGTVKIWDTFNSKKLPQVLDDHFSWVLTASFDPSGNEVISGSADNYIRVWPIEPSVLADRICELITRNLTQEEWNEYVGASIPYRKTCDIE